MKKLVIAEKPSVAISIAKVIGANAKKDGYYEGNGFIVSWCYGHLIELAEPDFYNDKYKKWNLKDLPIIPGEIKYVVKRTAKAQFAILKKLMSNKDTTSLVCACDAGREGEAIFRLVYMMAKCKKPIERLWISSMEDIAIKDGFDNLQPGEKYENLFSAAAARSIADWLVGINLSRLYSCLYGESYNVGRVQTPTLAMIVNRDYEIANFKKQKYYTVKLNFNDFSLSTERIDDLETAENLKNSVGDSIEIKSVEKKEKVTKPDLPYDLTTLQRECNKFFGFSAAETLDIAQSLYEKKLITYPRTDSRCLTEDMITSTINNILGQNDFDTERIKVVFNSKKVTDHHAIIPTISSLGEDIYKLPENEARVYRLISDKLHASVGYPLIENTTKVIAEHEYQGQIFAFKATGKTLKDIGFMKFMQEYKDKKSEDDKDDIFPDVKEGDELDIVEKSIEEKFTQPPKHFTEDTLLKAMEIAGNDVLEKGIEVERKGIGTPATRANIIENLVAREYIQREKKNLIATEKGEKLISLVAEIFRSPKMTAEWEMELSNISHGDFSKEEFLRKIQALITETVALYEKEEVKASNGSSSYSARYKSKKRRKNNK